LYRKKHSNCSFFANDIIIIIIIIFFFFFQGLLAV